MSLTMASILIVAKIGVRSTNVCPPVHFQMENHLHDEILDAQMAMELVQWCHQIGCIKL